MAAGSPSPMVSVRTPGHACRAPPHEVDLSARQTGWSRVEKRGLPHAIFLFVYYEKELKEGVTDVSSGDSSIVHTVSYHVSLSTQELFLRPNNVQTDLG